MLQYSKISPPRVQRRHMKRPRLETRLSSTEDGTFTLVSGEAGSGKTALASSWFAGLQGPRCWLTVDSTERDPRKFWSCIVAAIETTLPDIGDSVASTLDMARTASLSSSIHQLAAAVRSSGLVIVIDDYDKVISPEIDRTVDLFINLLPPDCRLVVVTRGAPDLSLARRRVAGTLCEIRCEDLRLTAEETIELNSTIGVGHLGAADLDVLQSVTEGWVSGVQLGILASQDHPDPQRFIQTFSGGDVRVADYLFHEVVDKQDPKTREFLLSTSSLSELTADLCASVLGESAADCHVMLRERERSCLFTDPMDDTGHLYRYTNMFATAVSERQRREDPAQFRLVNRRAAEWYVRKGVPEQAMRHAERTGDGEDVANVVEAFRDRLLFADAETEMLQRWLKKVPDTVLRARTGISLADAWLHVLTGRSSEIVKSFEHIRRRITLMSPDDPSFPRFRAECVALEALVPGLAETISIKALKALEEHLSTIAPTDPIRIGLLLGLGEAYCVRGDLDRASDVYAELMPMSLRLGDPFLTAVALTRRHDIAFVRGDLNERRRILDRLTTLVDDLTRPNPIVSGLHAWVEGRIQCDAGLFDDAGRTARNGIRRLHSVNAWVESGLHVITADALAAAGDTSGAVTAMMRAMVSPPSDWSKLSKCTKMAELHLHNGDLCSARYWIDKANLNMNRPGMREERDGVVYAKVLAAEGKENEALVILDSIMERGRDHGRLRCVIEAGIAAALVLDKVGERARAVDHLVAALEIAAPHEYVAVFSRHGEPMMSLLTAAAKHSRVRAYVRRLRHAISAQSGNPVAVKIARSEFAKAGLAPADRLSPREVEVLAMIAAGYTNKEVADLLSLSPQTIKVHARNIYSKLGVRNRTEAVRRARAMHLLHD